MKELETWDAMQLAFEYYKKDSITVLELNQWSDIYQDEHPDTYVHLCRDDIAYEHQCKNIWWEIRDFGSDILHKQASVICPICGDRHYKYPDVKVFEELIRKIEIWNSL